MSQTMRVLKAQQFAVAAHGDAKYGDLPFQYHLQKVVQASQDFVTDEMLAWAGATRTDLQVACWFHDLVEDTSVTLDMLRAFESELVVAAVDAVTDVEGTCRKERKWGTALCPGPMVKLHKSRLGLLVKLCDRIANVTASKAAAEKLPLHKQKKTMLPKYRQEHEDFVDLRTSSPVLDPLWSHLDTLLAVPA